MDAARSLERQEAYSKFAADFLDSLQGPGTLKAFGQSAERGRTLAKRAHDVFKSTMWVLATNSHSRYHRHGLALGAAAALTLGAYRVQAGDMEMATLLIILMIGIEVFRPQPPSRSLHNGMMGLSAAQGIFKVFDTGTQVCEPNEPTNLQQPLEPRISFNDVTFNTQQQQKQHSTNSIST